MFGMKKAAASCVGIIAIATIAGCAGIETSKYSYDPSYKVNQANKGEGCYDASVLLDKNAADSKDMAKKILVAIDSTITSEADNVIRAERNRHIGLFVGSGGEELSVMLKEVPGSKTFVTATTKTGFVGGAGQKAWSCQIVDELIKMASK
jgi:hypothetical protein